MWNVLVCDKQNNIHHISKQHEIPSELKGFPTLISVNGNFIDLLNTKNWNLAPPFDNHIHLRDSEGVVRDLTETEIGVVFLIIKTCRNWVEWDLNFERDENKRLMRQINSQKYTIALLTSALRIIATNSLSPDTREYAENILSLTDIKEE